MHELALIKKIIDNVEAAAKKASIGNVKIVRMRIGKMAGLEPDQLSFLYETYEKADCLKESKLEIEEIPVELECPECKHPFMDDRFNDYAFAHSVSHAPLVYSPPPCPKCGADGPIMIRGRELDLVNLDGE